MSRNEPTRQAILTGHLLKAFPGKHSVYYTARMVMDMQAMAKRLENIAVRACNGYHSDSQQTRDERARDRIRDKFTALLNAEFPGVTASFSGDPRGCVVRIEIPGERGDSWGGEGFGVYK